jgi:hypothetical protein
LKRFLIRGSIIHFLSSSHVLLKLNEPRQLLIYAGDEYLLEDNINTIKITQKLQLTIVGKLV